MLSFRNRFNTVLAATFLSAAMLFTGTVQAMEIQQFDKMAGEDHSDYVVVLIEGAQKVLIDDGKSDLALTIHQLFTQVPPGDDMPLGMTEFERNLARARLADAERLVKDPKAGRLEVEHAMIVTLKKNDIILPQSFMHVADKFKPKFPPKKN